MNNVIQILQKSYNPINEADMGKKMEFTDVFSRSAFDSDFNNLDLYNEG